MKIKIIATLTWVALLAGGILGAKEYANHEKQQIVSEVIAKLQANQQAQMKEVKNNVTTEFKTVSNSVENINGLLSYVKDNVTVSSDKTKALAAQLGELKSQIEDLKKSVDGLK